MEILDAKSGKLLLSDSIPLSQFEILSQLSTELNVPSSVLFLLSSTGVVVPPDAPMIPPARYFLLKRSGFTLQFQIDEVHRTRLDHSEVFTGDIFEEPIDFEDNPDLGVGCDRLPEVDKALFQLQESGIQRYLDYVNIVKPLNEMMTVLLNWKDVGVAVLLRTGKYMDDCDREFKEIAAESAFLPPRETAERCTRDLLQVSLEDYSNSTSSRLLSWLSSTRLGEAYILSLSRLTMKLSSIRHSIDVLKSDHLDPAFEALTDAWTTSEGRLSEIRSALSRENDLETGMRSIVQVYTAFRDQLLAIDNREQADQHEEDAQLVQPMQVIQVAHPVQSVQVIQAVQPAHVVQDAQLMQPVESLQEVQPQQEIEARLHEQVLEAVEPVNVIKAAQPIQHVLLEQLVSHSTEDIKRIQKELSKETSLISEANRAAEVMKDESKRIRRFVSEAAESAAFITAKLSVQFSQKVQKLRKSIAKLRKTSLLLDIPGHIKELSWEIDSELDRRKAATAHITALQNALIQSLETENVQRSVFVEKVGKVLPAKLIPELFEPALSRIPITCLNGNIGIQSDPTENLTSALITTLTPVPFDHQSLETASFRKVADLKTECIRLNSELRTLSKALTLEQLRSQRLEAALTNLNVESRILLSPGLFEHRIELESEVHKLIRREEDFIEMMRRQNAQMGRD